MRSQATAADTENHHHRYQFRLHPAATASSSSSSALTSMPVSVTTNGTVAITMQKQQQQQQQQSSKMDDNQQQQQQLPQQQQQQNAINNNNNSNNNNGDSGSNSASANNSNANNNNNNSNNIHAEHVKMSSNNNNTNNNSSNIVGAPAKCAPAATTTTNVCLSASSAISNTINGSSGSGNGGGVGGGNSQTSVLLRKQFISASTDASNASFSSASVAGSIQDDMLSDQCSLTQAGLEEYNIRASSYYDQPVLFHHQKQSSYAQSEGYHSYVSSSDSSSATPFLDRLRQESEMLSRQSSHHWSQNDLSSVSSNSVAPSPTPLLLSSLTRDSANGAHLQQHASNNNNSSESTSSTETLKWLGSMSDVSEASHATGYSAISESVSSSQLIVHSSRVPTPKRHHSESVLYLHDEQHSPNAAPQPMSASQLSADERELSPTRTLLPSHRHSPSYPPMHTPSLTLHPYQQPTHQQQHQQQQRQQLLMPLAKADDLLNSSLSVAANTAAKGTPAGSEPQPQPPPQSQHKTSISVTITSTESLFTISPQTPAIASKPVAPSAADDEAPFSASASQVIIAADGSAHSPQSAQSTAHTAALAVSNSSPTSPASSNNSPTGLSGTHSYRSNHRLFPVSTYTEPVHSNTSQYVHHPKPQYSAGLQKPPALMAQQQLATVPPPTPNSGQSKYATSPAQAAQPSWQSVAELINDFERSNSDPQVQAQKYTYIDPSKTHRVSNPALKAFQKNAVQSYFERQQQQHQHSKEHSQQKIYQSLAAHQHQHQHHLHQQQQHQQQQQLARPHSYQATNALKDSQQQMLRSSLPNTYAVACQPPPSQQPMRPLALPSMTSAQMSTSMNDSFLTAASSYSALPTKPPSPAPPPPPPRSRSLMPTTLLRRSSSASDYAEFRDQYTRASQEKLAAQSVKNISSSEKMSFNDCGMPPPPPPPRGRINPLSTRRTSSASEYAAAMREKALLQQAAALAHQQHHPHQHAPHARPHPHPYCIPSSAAAPPIDGSWVPERPPKNPNLRIPSPDLPPPPTAEVDTSLSDEPLPPPPPEILHRQPYYDSNGELAPKAPSPNRRNSFAGSSTRKAFFSRTSSASSETATSPSKVPPLIPKKPSNIELLQVTRPTGGFVPQPSKAHKLLLNGGMSHHHHHQQQKSSPPPPLPAVASSHAQNAKMTANRKRPHNPAAAMISVPPAIIENCNTKSPPTAAATATTRSSPPPPPLMPRCMPNTNQPANVVAITVTATNTNNKPRCNSKASYLPRQSLEKLNNSDPDHGSYKLTLTSNEDLVAHTQPSSYDILAHNGKLPNNLPDVLPLGAKLQPQPASPTSSNPSPLRYGSNNNLNASAHSMQQQQLQQSSPYPMYPPAQHRYSTPTMNSYNSNNKSGHTPGYTRSQSFDVNHSHAHNPNSPTKFMSQSTIDLKRTHHLEPTMEETAAMLSESASLLSPAQSENNLSSPSKQHAPPATQSLSSVSSSDGGGSEGRIFRAELVNATLSTSPSSSAPAGKTIARKDSLRENIEKITQLQSKLMSAHLSESSLISGYGSKTALNAGTPTASTATTKSLAQTEPKATEPLDSKQEHLTSSGSGSNADFSTAADCNANTEHSVSSSSHNDSTSSAMNALLPEKPASPLPQLTNVSTAPTASSSANSPLNTAAPTADDLVASQITQLNASTDGLKLMQRSEIILRVHPSTTEVASQTDDDLSASECDDMTRLAEQHQHQHAKEGAQQRITLQPRQPHPIELDCDSMSQELASLLAPNDKLVPILAPSMLKSPTDYVGNLYNPNVPQRPAKRDVGTSTLLRMKSRNAHDAQKVTVELQHTEVEVLLSNGGEADSCDLLKRKVDELIKQLNRKIRILSEEQLALNEESSLNDELGNNLVSKLTDKLRPIEATKCRTYIDDVGHITSLLLSLSERLAKAENSLGTIEAPASGDHSAEKKSLELKRERLLEQLAEAKRLKEDIERRGSSVVNMLEKNLTADEFADFDYFINMKAKLIADSRDIADKIKCGEEQLNALSEALIQSDC